MRIAVVGGGVIGLACAWRLAGDGHAVTLFDGAREAREASWAAAGMLAPHHEATADDGVWRLGTASLARWPAFAAALGAELDVSFSGGLLPLITAADQPLIDAKQRFLTAHGLTATWLDQRELNQREPALHAGGALLVPGGRVDPRRLTQALRHACAARHVDLRYGKAVTAILEGGLVVGGCSSGEKSSGRESSGTEHRCDLTVLANGAWTPALAQLAGIALEGEPVKGQLLRFGVADGVLRHFIHCHHAYLVPRAGAGVVVGSTMVWSGFDKTPDDDAIAELAAQARRLLPTLRDAPISETWTGLRPRLRTGMPVLQRVRDDLIIATGHFRNGILLTPITADAIAELAGGKSCGVDVSEYRL